MKALRLFIIITAMLWALPALAQFPLALMQKQAEQGDALSQYMLGVAYAIGEGVPKDDVKAAYWVGKAAEQKVAEAQLLLGTYYFKGQGVPKDNAKAVQWFLKAAEQGNIDAQNILDELAK